MENRVEAIRKQSADMLAVERHILEAVERQRESEDLARLVEANKVVIQIERTLNEHIIALEQVIREYEGETESFLKKTVTGVMGLLAGLYDKVREHTVSRMLRDDYTALSLAAMSYTMYHAFGLSIKEGRIADLALRHLKDLTPLLVELSRVLPAVTVYEVAEEAEGFVVDTTVTPEAVRNTQRAWSAEVTQAS